VWVGFLYTLVARIFSGFPATSACSKASWASDSLYCKSDCGFCGVDVAMEVISEVGFKATTVAIYVSFPELG